MARRTIHRVDARDHGATRTLHTNSNASVYLYPGPAVRRLPAITHAARVGMRIYKGGYNTLEALSKSRSSTMGIATTWCWGGGGTAADDMAHTGAAGPPWQLQTQCCSNECWKCDWPRTVTVPVGGLYGGFMIGGFEIDRKAGETLQPCRGLREFPVQPGEMNTTRWFVFLTRTGCEREIGVGLHVLIMMLNNGDIFIVTLRILDCSLFQVESAYHLGIKSAGEEDGMMGA
ncbi:hypothetical protein BU17DRAFT_64834 [Hysterangium stoloniferum]|nr:hypothetical protein BU17DRAFT_64834 [Hysterangium stoloniferum]